jgi:hypothetical protein
VPALDPERPQVRRIVRRILLTVLTGCVTFILTNLTNQPMVWVLTLSVLIGGIALLAQFLVELEQRQELVEHRMADLERNGSALVPRLAETVRHEVSRFNETARLLDRLAGSTPKAESMLRLIRLSADLPPESSVLARDLVQAQVDAAVSLMEQLGHGGEISYDGEDREWLLTLTARVRHTIKATSRGTTGPDGMSFVDGGLWDSELGYRYLDAQREAVRRGVTIQRIFVLEHGELALDATFRRMYERQRAAGIAVRVLDAASQTSGQMLLLPDMAIFDDEVSYEMTSGPRLAIGQPPYLKTLLLLRPQAVQSRVQRFNDFWEAAQEVGSPEEISPGH